MDVFPLTDIFVTIIVVNYSQAPSSKQAIRCKYNRKLNWRRGFEKKRKEKLNWLEKTDQKPKTVSDLKTETDPTLMLIVSSRLGKCYDMVYCQITVYRPKWHTKITLWMNDLQIKCW